MSRPQFKRVEAFNPKQISGCQLWLDGADTSSMTLSGSSVTAWNDKSGSSNHFTPTSGTPTSISDNGRTVVNFTSGTIMRSANQITFTTSSAFFIVSRLNLVNASNAGMLLDFTFWNGYKSIRFYGPVGILGGTPATFGDEYELANGAYFVNGTFNPSFGSSTYLNTYSLIGTVAPQSGGTSYLAFSSSFYERYFIGNIAEFLYYPSGITSSQRQQVEGYLAQKWGLRSSLPGGHPGITSIIYPTPRRTATVNMTMSLRPYYTEFSPRSIAGCSMWVDGADPAGTGTPPAAGSTVTTWKDKSGNVNDGTSGTATFQTDSLGGYINFTGSQYYSITNPNIVVNQYFTVFVVEQIGSVPLSSVYALMGGVNGTNENLHIVYRNNTPVITFAFYYNDINVNVSSYGYGTGGAQPTRLWTFSFIANSRNIYLNGTSIGSDTNNTFLSGWAGARIASAFSSEYYIGKMREIIIYSGTITTNQRQQVESYLAQKWGLTASLPAGHLNTTQPVGIPRFVTQVKQKIQSVRFLNYPTITNANSNITYGGYIFYYFTTVGDTSTAITNTGGTTINAFILGGGGGGGSWVGGGGGAGGLCMKSDLYSGPYTVTVGGGGNGGAQGRNAGAVGGNSQFSTFIGYGGGGGRDAFAAGLNGGCGGGGGYGNYSGGSATQPSSVSGGFGYAGGYASSGPAGGGGGIGSAGVSNYTDLGISNQNGLNGGFGYGGTSNSTFLDGRAYGGGGGGGTNGNDGTYMTGGVGFSGGGNGGIGAPIGTPGAAGSPGTANTGGGGGGGGNWNGGGAQNPGGNGGSGIVILYHLL